MLERCFSRLATRDRIRSYWIGPAIERYVAWLEQHGFELGAARWRVPRILDFGEFARKRGARSLEDLPAHVEAFVRERLQVPWPKWATTNSFRRRRFALQWREPIEAMLRLALTDFSGSPKRTRVVYVYPFTRAVPGFMEYLREERGLKSDTIENYGRALAHLARFLGSTTKAGLRSLTPERLGGFVRCAAQGPFRRSMNVAASSLRVFLRYLHRERILLRDLSTTVDRPSRYTLSDVPRAVSWKDASAMLEAVDRSTALGRRDYAILLLFVTYGLRAHEVARLTLADLDWRAGRLRIPERKSGHSTAYPLSAGVGRAILAYLKDGRPKTVERRLFLTSTAPIRPMESPAVSARASHYLEKIGVKVARMGSHTLRHTCVQRLVDQNFPLKVIGDYVGHRAVASTRIYAKVDVEGLREVALGDGEDVL